MRLLRAHFKSLIGRLLIPAALLSGVSLGYPAPGTGQPAALPAELSSNRYLLIVDTSRGMEPRQRGMLKTVQDLLKSGMGGQMREGDTLGVWTYNARLYAGQFPLQRWSPGQQKAITARAVGFLKGQKFELLPVLDEVLPALDNVVRNSELITVILITAGDGAMQGTRFDHVINEFWDRARDRQQSAKMPIVVVLRAREGVIKNCTLNLPPGPVEMPPLSAETSVAAAPPVPAITEAPQKPQIPAAQPQDLSGKKPKPLQPPKADDGTAVRVRSTAAVTTNEPPAEEASPSQAAPAVNVEAAKAEAAPVKAAVPTLPAAPASNVPSAIKAEQPKPPPPITEAAKAEETRKTPPVAETAKTEPKPTPPPKPAFPPPPAQTAAAVQSTNAAAAPMPKPDPVKAPEEKPISVATAQAAAEAPSATPKAEPAKPAEPKPAQAAPARVTAAPLPPPPPLPPAKAIEAPKLAFGPKPTFEPASASPATNVVPPAVTPIASGDHTANPPPTAISSPRPSISGTGSPVAASAPSAPQPPPAPPTQTATATPAVSFLNQTTTWIAGMLLAAAACAFAWLALRRSRATPHGSLITRSLDSGRKPDRGRKRRR